MLPTGRRCNAITSSQPGDTKSGVREMMPMAQPGPASALMINRELSWLAFNERVLAQALNPETPLLEQAKFSAIFSNNLDEFFMVRVASLKAQVEAGVERLSEDGMTAGQQLSAIRRRLEPLVRRQQAHFREQLKPQLLSRGVHLLDYRQLTRRQKDWANSYFQRAVVPLLTPLAVNPADPFPFISNLSLNIAVDLSDPDRQSRRLARLKLPQRSLPRFVAIPGELHGGRMPTPRHIAVPLEQVVGVNLQRLFPGSTIEGHSIFRVTRDADLELRELEADDLMAALEQGLRKRRMGGEVVRLEVGHTMPEHVLNQLMRGMQVEAGDVFRINGPLGLDDLMQLLSIAAPDLKDKPFQGRTPKRLKSRNSIFSVLRQGDLLLHHPFDLFSSSVEEFINQAADDASVQAIKITLYRVSKDSAIIAALIRAAENGKQVMALVELKARFDEGNNIQWARQLERSGVHVVYGVIGLKTHTKLALVVRQERQGLRGYVHVATGNYNSRTAALYTDLGVLSCREELVQDAVELFNGLTGYSKQREYRQMLVAPVSLRRRMEELIRREIDHARRGRRSGIQAKMNSLVDPSTIALLYEASQAGVPIDLVVRGMCSLRPGIRGVSETIRVRSIIGRFLEHSRLVRFSNGGDAELYLGSADWMERNLDRRVEAVVPILDAQLCVELEWLLDRYLQDNQAAWELSADGSYRQLRGDSPTVLAQAELMELWGRTVSTPRR